MKIGAGSGCPPLIFSGCFWAKGAPRPLRVPGICRQIPARAGRPRQSGRGAKGRMGVGRMQEERLAGGTRVYVTERHRFGTDAMLLSWFCDVHRDWAACDLGSGCGILPLRWHDRGHRGPAFGLELDPEGAQLLERAAQASGAGHITALQGDLRVLPQALGRGRFDLVSCNPPYFTGGLRSEKPGRAAARHELSCTVGQVCQAAAALLKGGGRLCLCCRPERLTDCMVAMRENGIEPKRLQWVRQRAGALPWLFLLDGRRGRRSGLQLQPDILIEGPGGGFSDQLLQIYGKAPPAGGAAEEAAGAGEKG